MTMTNAVTNDISRATGSWTLDPAKTTIEFRTKAMWVLPVKGTAQAIGGDARVSQTGDVAGSLTIDAGSFDTNNRKRDEHLRSADFFEVIAYPTISFVTRQARYIDDGRVEIDGELTVHGRTRPLTLIADVTIVDGRTATVATEVDIDRRDFGVSWAKMGAGLKNQVTIHAHFDRS